MMWDEKKMVVPCWVRRRMISRMVRELMGSMPSNGSSRKRTCGLWINAAPNSSTRLVRYCGCEHRHLVLSGLEHLLPCVLVPVIWICDASKLREIIPLQLQLLFLFQLD